MTGHNLPVLDVSEMTQVTRPRGWELRMRTVTRIVVAIETPAAACEFALIERCLSPFADIEISAGNNMPVCAFFKATMIDCAREVARDGFSLKNRGAIAVQRLTSDRRRLLGPFTLTTPRIKTLRVLPYES
jgi:hypothetical protein